MSGEEAIIADGPPSLATRSDLTTVQIYLRFLRTIGTRPINPVAVPERLAPALYLHRDCV